MKSRAALVGGLVAIGIALLSPLESMAHDLFSAHMAQHLILIYVAAPLLVLGLPGLRLPRLVTGVVTVWVLHVGALWAWHLPSLYSAALRNNPLHGIEHLSFLGTAMLFWSVLLHPDVRRRLAHPAALILVFLTAVASGALGAVLTFATTPLYEVHAGTTGSLTQLEDQQLAGLVMWIPTGVVYLGAACVLFVKWLRSMEAVAVTLVAVAVALGAWALDTRPGAAQDLPEVTAPDLYLADCAWCHGNTGGGTANGPPLDGGPAAADFYLRTGRMPIDEPDEVVTRGEPIYGEEQIDELVAYVGSLGTGPEIPDAAGGDVAAGNELYIDNCAACHSTSGIGAALTSGLVAPDLFESSPVEVAEAIRIGPGTMPVFGAETFDDEQVKDIVAYVSYIQEPQDPGGAPLGHVGPITEGAVGWLVGAGLMLLIIRWIGTRADE